MQPLTRPFTPAQRLHNKSDFDRVYEEALAVGLRPILTFRNAPCWAAVVSDERIVRAIEYIRSHLGQPLTLEDVAREAYLSPSRFRHLFVEQTGTVLRSYVLWRRFLLAWEVVTRGGTLSAAAHRAGFADAAHLTRTSHRMFGFAPSALQVNVRTD